VYVAGNDFRAYAVDPATGKKRWECTLPPGQSCRQTPFTTDEGLLIVESGGTVIIGIDCATGEKKWASDDAGFLSSTAPLVYKDGVIYAGGSEGVTAVDASTGRAKWSCRTRGTAHLSKDITDSGTLFAAGAQGDVYAIDVAKGEERWSFKTRDDLYFPPALSPQGTVIAVGSENDVYCIKGDRAPDWEIEPAEEVKDSSLTEEDGYLFIDEVKMEIKK
jgi:outer membrane protein assembly factor BamB